MGQGTTDRTMAALAGCAWGRAESLSSAPGLTPPLPKAWPPLITDPSPSGSGAMRPHPPGTLPVGPWPLSLLPGIIGQSSSCPPGDHLLYGWLWPLPRGLATRLRSG